MKRSMTGLSDDNHTLPQTTVIFNVYLLLITVTTDSYDTHSKKTRGERPDDKMDLNFKYVANKALIDTPKILERTNMSFPRPYASRRTWHFHEFWRVR